MLSLHSQGAFECLAPIATSRADRLDVHLHNAGVAAA